jgi:hypothetical protein
MKQYKWQNQLHGSFIMNLNPLDYESFLLDMPLLASWSALFIKIKNHVRACPLLKLPCIHFTFAKIKQYTYKSHCFKIHFHTYTRVQKQIQNLYITCVQMFGNEKIWLYYMYNIKSWIFSDKVVKDFFITWMKFVRVCFSIICQIGQNNNCIQFYIVTFKYGRYLMDEKMHDSWSRSDLNA